VGQDRVKREKGESQRGKFWVLVCEKNDFPVTEEFASPMLGPSCLPGLEKGKKHMFLISLQISCKKLEGFFSCLDLENRLTINFLIPKL
jgi:hypothetical protein